MPQWFDPLNDTPIGRLLKDVKELSKAVRKGEGEYENKLERLERKCRQAMKDGKDVDLEAIVSQITGDSSGRTEHHGMLMNDGREFLSSLSKSVRNKRKADLDKDGKLSGYEKKRAKAIEASMGYKSDRGDGPKPKLPSPKKDKAVIKFDASDNCPICKANPHEECGGGGEMAAINCMKNPVALDSRLDDMRQHSFREHIDEGHGMPLVLRARLHSMAKSEEKNTQCSDCKNVECMGDCGGGMKKADMDEKNKYCRKHFGCSYSECTPKQKAQCDRECGKEVSKADMSEKNKYCQKHFGCNYSQCTSKQKAQCERECGKGGEVKKYEREPSLSNSVPTFQNVDGGTPVRATGFTTNQRIPHFENGVKKTIVSESAKIPAYAQTGYANTSSSMHMHLTDGGNSGQPPNLARIEESLATFTKGASRAEVGTIAEIESLLKQIKERTQQ